ncbi:MAG TPA: hypothetical protein VGM78_05090 [Ilumatobacteraceae bacterium]|jgi:hypothetical protein
MNAFVTSPHADRAVRTTRLLVLVTATAALAAWLLAGVAHLSEHAVVITVMVAAFAASWIFTNHRHAARHRVTVIHVRSRSHS